MERKWRPFRFVPFMTGKEICEGYRERGVKFNRDVFKEDKKTAMVFVDIFIIEMINFKK